MLPTGRLPRVSRLLRTFNRVTRPLHRPVLHAVVAAPGPLRRLLAGPPVVVDGRTLDPELQAVIRLQQLTGERVLERPQDVARMRADMRYQTLLIGGHPPDRPGRGLHGARPRGSAAGAAVRTAGGRAAYAAARLLPRRRLGDGALDIYDPQCGALAESRGLRVLSVDYRLAPEHPYPPAADDAWALARGGAPCGRLGADPARHRRGGDSAGGNLAAVTALRAARRTRPTPPAFQLLIYPGLDMTRKHPSRLGAFRRRLSLAEGHGRSRAAYVPEPARRADPRVSPVPPRGPGGRRARARRHRRLADPLRDEGDLVAPRLRAAGVPVEHWCEDAMPHGYASFTGVGTNTTAAIDRIVVALRRRLG